ncbi:MAG: sigma-70 family RNA polymerase sigma factor [Hespellia sp.]|nr:sigma-70 family RNA polymerase sigma factor [Hespellia sp.]
MKHKENCTGKLQNTFTSYLLITIKGTKNRYLDKKDAYTNRERYLEDMLYNEPAIGFEETYEQHQKEQILEKELRGEYTEWSDLTDERLVEAILMLNAHERQILYMRVFKEKSLGEISRETGISRKQVDGWYYYALQKIRKWMRGE